MDFINEYIKKTPASAEAAKRAEKLIPGGVGTPFRYWEPYPIHVTKSKDAYVWDEDGNKYIDFSMAFAGMFAGHANPVIAEAIRKQLEKGTLYGLPHENTYLMMNELHRRYPVLEMMRFCQDGTEATLYAIRVARAATKKWGVIKCEGMYHGLHDTVLNSTAVPSNVPAGPEWMPTTIIESEGILPEAVKYTYNVQFNHLESLEYQLEKHEGEIACFILEPCMTNGGVIPPDPGYLEGVRKLCDKYNVLLIFDEVKVGCRIAPGGACELYGIKPDLVCLAKAIGGGTSLGAFGGRADLMGEIAPLGHIVHAGTYNANPLVMAAGVACLTEVLTDDVYDRVNHLGKKYAEGNEDIIKRLQMPLCVTWEGPLGGLQFVPEKPHTYREANQANIDMWNDYWYGMLSRGVIPMGHFWNEEYSISAAHTEEDIDTALSVTEDVLKEIKKKHM